MSFWLKTILISTVATSAQALALPSLNPSVDMLAPVTPTLSRPVAELSHPQAWKPGDPIKEIPKRRGTPKVIHQTDPNVLDADPLIDAQRQTAASLRDPSFNTSLVNVAGQGFTGVNPPDTVGDVGQNHYIQMINGSGGAVFTIYNKADGSIAAGPTQLDSLGSEYCAYGHGDPVVLYDELADRWLMSEFSTAGNFLCIYVSQTSSPLGSWYSYAFAPPYFPDYPKYAVWNDAYYVSANEYPSVYALNRDKMLAGHPASMIRITHEPLDGFSFQAMTPADPDGTSQPPAGAPGLFMRHRDDEAHNPGANNPNEDYLELWAFTPDFSTPANSTFSKLQDIPVAEFDSSLCGLTSYYCFPQPGTTTTLDPLREVIMFRLAYRNLHHHQSLVGNFVTDIGGNIGGVRWFELRKQGSTWSLFQEGTYSPDNTNRWMGAIAMDGSGNIALGYNASSSLVYPSLRYAGRLRGDATGTLPQGENTLIAGTSFNSSNRYGDYAAMSLDPSDQCTFWFTGEYNASSHWSTRIGAFKFDSCTGTYPYFELDSPTNLTPEVCTGAPYPITLELTSQVGFNSPVSLSAPSLPPGFSANFSTNPVVPDGQSIVTITPGPNSGVFNFNILGASAGFDSETLAVSMQVSKTAEAPSLIWPGNGSSVEAPTITAFWASAQGASNYLLEVATDPGFSNIIHSIPTTDTQAEIAGLAPSSTYYWRVTASNSCSSSVTTSRSFTTAPAEICSSPELAIPDNDPAGLTDGLTAGALGNLVDLNVVLDISHSQIGDLRVQLEHVDTGTLIDLVNQPPATTGACAAADIQVVLDDEAQAGPFDAACPPTTSQAYTPLNPLSTFEGESMQGAWRLKVIDLAPSHTGVLNQWCLRPNTPAPINCNGATVDIAQSYIPSGQTLICNGGDFTLSNLVLGGSLSITKSGSAVMNGHLRTLDGGSLTIIQAP